MSSPVVPELLSLPDEVVVGSSVVDPVSDPLEVSEELAPVLGPVGLVIVALVLGPAVLVSASVSASATSFPHAVADRLNPTPSPTSDSQANVKFFIAVPQRTARALSNVRCGSQRAILIRQRRLLPNAAAVPRASPRFSCSETSPLTLPKCSAAAEHGPDVGQRVVTHPSSPIGSTRGAQIVSHQQITPASLRSARGRKRHFSRRPAGRRTSSRNVDFSKKLTATRRTGVTIARSCRTSSNNQTASLLARLC